MTDRDRAAAGADRLLLDNMDVARCGGGRAGAGRCRRKRRARHPTPSAASPRGSRLHSGGRIPVGAPATSGSIMRAAEDIRIPTKMDLFRIAGVAFISPYGQEKGVVKGPALSTVAAKLAADRSGKA